MTVSKFCRQAMTALAIVAFAPLGLAVLDMTPSAYAKGNGGKGGGGGSGDHGNSGGHGNGHGNGKGNGKGQGKADADQVSAGKSTAATGQTKKLTVLEDGTVAVVEGTPTSVLEDPSLHPSALGKLNGVLNASNTALEHASANSPKGIAASALRDALAANSDSDPTNDVTPQEMGAILDSITNKEVTAAQVQAVADKLAEIDPSLSSYDLDVEQDPAVEAENQAVADAAADEANELKGIEPEPDDDIDNNGVPDALE